MKVSIWQQFSSNHSAHYTVVGKFASVDEASQVAEKIKDILMDIMVDYDNVPKDFPNDMSISKSKEEAIGEQYGFDWQEKIDWLWAMYHNRENALKQVHHWDAYVAVDSTWTSTWQTGHQFRNLMKALGGGSLQRDLRWNNTRL